MGLLNKYKEGEMPTASEWNKLVDVVEALLTMRVDGGAFHASPKGFALTLPAHQPVELGELTTAMTAATNPTTGQTTASWKRYTRNGSGVVIQDQIETVTNRSVDLTASSGTFIVCIKNKWNEWMPIWVDCS